MRIGIDAFGYFDGYASLQRVTSNLVNYLLLNDQVNEYVLFLDKRFENTPFPVKSNARVTFRYLRTGSLKYNFFQKVIILPYYSYLDKIDIFITQYYPSPFSRGKRISFVFDILFESFPSLFTKRERYQLKPQKFFTKTAQYVITISESEKRRLLEFNYAKDPEKIHVFYLAAEEQFKPRSAFSNERLQEVKKKYNLPDEYLLYVGLLSGRKNLDNLLRALPLVKHPAPLVIIGKKHSSYPSNHLSIIEELKLDQRVLFTGFVDDDDLAAVYALATVFCFPSFAEGFGLPPLEALSAGIPVASSDRTSLTEVCGDAGVYFDPDHPGQIADALNKLLLEPEFYKEKKRQSLIQASTFSWQKSAERLITFLNNLPD